jgi:RNA polymerase sigma-70 factor (ECF subfamily)
MMKFGRAGNGVEWFEDLYERYFRKVAGYIRHTFKFEYEEACDLAQDAFARVYDGMDQYRGEAEWSYLQVTAKRVALNKIRERSTQKRHVDSVPIEELFDRPELSTQAPDHGQLEEDAMQKAQLYTAINQLSPSLSRPVQLALGGLSYQEIADTMGITVDAVKSRLKDARKKLAALVARDTRDRS